MKVLICYYSTYGNVYKMANLVAEGVGQVAGAGQSTARRQMYRPPTPGPRVTRRPGASERPPVCTAPPSKDMLQVHEKRWQEP